MLEKMKWDTAYELWKRGSYYLPNILNEPLSAETIFTEYNQDGYFYGYDWLENTTVQERRQLIENDLAGFFLFTDATNKGTIHTAEMLIEAQNEEELAAIWIAATGKELSENSTNNDIKRYAYVLYMAAYDFLKSRYNLWHHAMKKLVPQILIPFSIQMNLACEDAETVMDLIQMNTIMLKGSYSILRYSSLKEDEFPESHCRIDF